MQRIDIPFDVHRPLPELIEQVEQITRNAPTNLVEAQRCIKTLANALVAVAQHCHDLDRIIETMIQRVDWKLKD